MDPITPCGTGGRKLSVGDCALFQAGNGPPFIGILRELTQEKDSTKLGVNWLYRPADVKLTKGGPPEAAPNEIFYSFHKDEISAASLLHPCKVAFLRKGAELPPGVSSFVCRRVYDTANKCLWWLTDRDYTDEHQDEVDQLLDRTKLEMQAAVQSGGPSPRALTGPTSSQQLKSSSEVVQNATYSAPSKSKKRERTDQSLEPSKRERSVKSEDGELSPLKRERSMKPEEIASITDKDGGFLNPTCVDRLVQLMQQVPNDGIRKAADVASRRTMLACVVAATEREDCLNRFVQLGGLPMLDDWLQEAHKGKVGDGGSPKEGDKGVEELLLTLLKALDKLPVDLDALKTCSVGKSVNHLRSHKNLEIQKKARKLVDIWKKRVDAEMKLSGEVKSPSNHAIWSSYKQNSPDMMHSHLMKSGVPTEVAVKSSGAFAGSAKPMPNGTSSVDGISKLGSIPASAGKISTMLASATPPTVKREENGISKLSSGPIPSDVPVSVKEEKSSTSLQPLSNGQTWVSGQQGKSGASSTWKDDGKNSSMGGAMSSKPMGPGSRHPSLPGKGLLGASLTGGSKEVLSGKPLVWSRSASSDKLSTSTPSPVEKIPVDASRESPNAQHRLIVRIPNPGRSPARMSGGSFEQTTPGSRGLSPNVPERSSSMSLDASDVKSRVPNGNLTSVSPEASSEVKVSAGARPVTGMEDERDKASTYVQPDSAMDGETRAEESSRVEPERNVKEGNEQNGAGGLVQRNGTPERSTEAEDVKKGEKATGATGPSADVAVSEATAMEVDDLGISLLASVAASEIRRTGANGTMHDRTNPEEVSVDQDRASRVSSDATSSHLKASENQNIVKESGDGNHQTESNGKQDACGNNLTNGREEDSAEQEGEGNGGKARDVDSKKEVLQESLSPRRDGESKDAERRHFASQEVVRLLQSSGGSGAGKYSHDHKVEDRHLADSETESAPLPTVSTLPFCKEKTAVGSGAVGPLDGHSSKSAKKDGSDDKNMQSHGKGIELCNGYGSTAGDMKNCQTVASADSECKPEDLKVSVEVGQTPGRRGMDIDGGQTAEMSGVFPQEDVLEVARQVAKEVEQMERYGKSVASSSEKAVQDVMSPSCKASELREVNYPDGGRELRWKAQSLEKGTDEDTWTRNVPYSEEVREVVSERIDQSIAVRSSGTGEAETDLSRRVNGSVERKVSGSVSEALEAVFDGTQELKRRVMDVRAHGMVPSFPSPQMMGLPNLASSTLVAVNPQHIVKPAPRTMPAGEPTTPEQATETACPSEGVVGGSDVSERPDFDLNEGFSVEESPQDDSTTSPVAPVPVVAASASVPAAATLLAAPIAKVSATKGGFVLPVSPIRTKSELGWKGSAATSAFRPAEPRRTPERQPSAGENLVLEGSTGSTAKKVRPPLDLNIDLNVMDDRSFEDNGLAAAATASSMSSQGSAVGVSTQAPLASVSASSLTFQSDHSNSGAGPPAHNGGNTPARPILDLNMLDESEEGETLLNLDARVAQAMAPSARSNNSSSLQVTRRVGVVRDFDLNDGPAEDGVADDQPVLPLLSSRSTGASVMSAGPGPRRGPEVGNASWFAANSAFKAGIPDFSSTRAESPYSVAAAAAAQSYLSAGAGSVPFNTDLYRAGVALSAAPPMAYASGNQGAYPYSGFPLASGFPFTSAANFSGNNGTPYLDSSGSISFPIASSGTVTSHLPRPPPYLMGLSEVGSSDSGGGGWSARPSLDLNAGPEAGDGDGAREDIMNLRQPTMLGGQSPLDQMRVFRQVVNAAGPGVAPPLKRKEPESGWGEMNRSNGFKQQAWR